MQVPDLQPNFKSVLLSTPSQAYRTVSDPKVFLDLVRHLSVHPSSSMRSAAVFPAIFRGGYVTGLGTCKQCPRLLGECRSFRSNRGPGPGPGPDPVPDSKSEGPDHYDTVPHGSRDHGSIFATYVRTRADIDIVKAVK